MPDLSQPDVSVYRSGGSRPSFNALDEARNRLDALRTRRMDTVLALREVILQAAKELQASGTEISRAYDCVDELAADLFYDAETDISNEIVELEDRLGDGA